MTSTTTAQAIASGDLTDLVSSPSSEADAVTIYPTDDSILSVLQSRFRADLPYTRLGSTGLISVNPFKSLASTNDASRKEYEERCYKDTSLPLVDSPKPLQPHVFDLAARCYLVMRRKGESQGVVARYALSLSTRVHSSSSELFIEGLVLDPHPSPLPFSSPSLSND
jgi:chitin synthase